MNLWEDINGQGTLEFALVTAAFLSIVIVLASLWQAIEGGLFVEHALATASHHVHMVSTGVVGDVFLY